MSSPIVRRPFRPTVAAAAAGLAGLAAAAPAVACDALVDFSSQPIGMAWGAAFGTPPGVTQFTESAIDVQFVPNAAGAFNLARIVPPIAGFGSGEVMSVNNILVGFDLAALPCVAKVTIEFADLGGTENLIVNGAPIYVGEIAAVPAAIAPGVTAAVSTSPIPGGVAGTLVLTGPVMQFGIAGQEFWIDDVCVTFCDDPPPTPDCDQLMDFESQAIGSTWGGPAGTPPGVVQFVEDGISARFVPTTGGAYDVARIDPAFPFFPASHILALQNIALGVDTSLLGCAETVTFRYLDLGGTEELAVNGAPAWVGDIAAAPVAIAPGVTCTVTAVPVPGGKRGRVTLVGRVDRVVIAGQEFWIDDICVEVADCPADVDCDGIVGFSDLVAVLAAWGPCPAPCPEDVNGDGTVDFDDLILLLAAWGSC